MSKKFPSEYLEGYWNYIHTINAKDGRVEDFLKCLEIDKSEPLPMSIKTGRMDSVYPFLTKLNPKIKIDVYRGRGSQPETPTFREQYGSTITALLQAGFTFNKITITREKDILEARKKAISLDAKLDF